MSNMNSPLDEEIMPSMGGPSVAISEIEDALQELTRQKYAYKKIDIEKACGGLQRGSQKNVRFSEDSLIEHYPDIWFAISELSAEELAGIKIKVSEVAGRRKFDFSEWNVTEELVGYLSDRFFQRKFILSESPLIDPYDFPDVINKFKNHVRDKQVLDYLNGLVERAQKGQEKIREIFKSRVTKG